MPAQLRRHRSNFVELSAWPPSPPSSICKLIRSSRRPPWSLAAESRRSFARGMARAGSGRAQTADLAGSAAELRRDTLKLGRGELPGDRLDRARQYRRRVSRAQRGLSYPGSKAARKREADRRASMSGTTAGASLGSSGLAPPLPKSPATPKLFQILGPGLISGASDDDPSGIATYSRVGAQLGYGRGRLCSRRSLGSPQPLWR